MKKSAYRVTFKVEHTNSTRTLHLYNGTESEAIEALYKSGTVSRDKTIIILSIEEV